MTSADQVEIDSNPSRAITSDSIGFGIAFALVLTGLQRIVGFGRGVFFCKAMTDDELGQWSMVYSFLLLLAPLSVLGLPGSFCRYLEHFRQKGQMHHYLRQLTSVSLLGACGLVGAMMVSPEIFSNIIFGEPTATLLVRAMSVTLASVIVTNYLTSLLEGLRQVRLVTLMRFVTAISFAVFGLAFAFTWKDAALGVTLAFGIANVLGIVPTFFFFFRHRRDFAAQPEAAHPSRLWQLIIPFATWMWLSNFLNNTYEVADRVMLIHLTEGTQAMAQAAVGQYHSGRILPLMLVSVAVLLSGLLMPYLSEAWENGQFEKAKRQLRWATKLVGMGFTAIGMGLLLFAPLIFDGILQGRYNDGLSVLPLTLVYCIWYSLLAIAQNFLWCREKGFWAVLAIGAGLAVNIIANLILIPHFGLYGAVMATALSNLACLGILMILNRHFGMPADGAQWLVAAVPLLLMLPVAYGFASLVLVSIAALRYEWVFDEQEKRQIWQVIEKAFDRFGFTSRRASEC